MINQVGDMWQSYSSSDVFCITTNSYIRRDGRLVMGRGIVLEAAIRFPYLAFEAGKKIKMLSAYHILDCDDVTLFQVKYHFKDQADIELIEESVRLFALRANASPSNRFDLNYPGIGLGGLPIYMVKPIVETLPDNVYVWKYN